MSLEPIKTESIANDGPIKTPSRDLSSIWMGSDQNIESSFVTDENGRLKHFWISALSERGKERFVFSNQERDGFNAIPTDTGEALSHLYQPIIAKKRSLSESIADIAGVIEPVMYTGVWTRGVGEDMFTLPAGLTSQRPVALMPTFDAFVENPTLGRNLFAVGCAASDVGIFINETENFSIIAFPGSVHKIPGAAVPSGTLREFTFRHANMLVEGEYQAFFEAVGRFRVLKTWQQAGGPAVMTARPIEDGAVMSPFKV